MRGPSKGGFEFPSFRLNEGTLSAVVPCTASIKFGDGLGNGSGDWVLKVLELEIWTERGGLPNLLYSI